MVVRTQSMGRLVSGLLVEPEDVRRYFPEHLSDIELELGHLRIHCVLTPRFWDSRHLIDDPRLCAWLDFKIFHGRACRFSIPLEMVPVGSNAFSIIAPSQCDGTPCNFQGNALGDCCIFVDPGIKPANDHAEPPETGAQPLAASR